MEKREANISFSRSGNGIGARIILSVPLLKKLGINQENRAVEVIYDEDAKTVTIRKKD